MKEFWFKFASINSIFGLFFGSYVAYSAIGNGYWVFIVATPLAVFITAAIFSKILIKNWSKTSNARIILVGLLTGTISHYITFILLSIGANICFWLTGCTNSLGEPPVNIGTVILHGWMLSIFSIIFLGWLTIPISILIGFVLKNVNIRSS